jgi:hypothetical protein
MDPREFLKLASELVANVTPATIRTGINRAYYAAHNVGVEVLTEMGCTIEKGPGGHGDVWMRLNNSGNKEIIMAGSQLGDLQTKRNKADYRMDNKEVEDQKTAKALVEQARRIIQTLDGCRGGSKSAQVKKAILEWEQKVGET